MASEEVKEDDVRGVDAVVSAEEQKALIENADSSHLAQEKEVEEDDETWTNQPKGDAVEAETLDGDCDEEEDDTQTGASRKRIETAGDVLMEELPYRADKAAARLKPFLTAQVVFEMSSSGEKYLFEWAEQGPKVSQLEKDVVISVDGEEELEGAKSLKVDSIICLSERAVMAIRAGDLNPQVGMLTDKIRVSGQIGPAVYIFNVIAPRSRP